MTNQIKPIVEVINNKAITYSTNIADVFNKSHDDLFRKITKLEQDVRKKSEMFEKSIYTDTYGRKQPCYKLNRDGAVLLIMGFTGKKALEFKLKYIEAFNMMEAKLKELSNKPDFTTTLTTVKQHIRKLPTVRIKKEMTFPEEAYRRLGGVINRCIDARFERLEKYIREPKLDFEKMDIPTAQKYNISTYKDMNDSISKYGRSCQLIGQLQGVMELRKILPEDLYNQVKVYMVNRK